MPTEGRAACRDGEGAASPEGILHSDSQYLPLILVYFIHLNGVVNLLLGTSEKSPKGIDMLVSYRASTQIVSLVFHRCNLVPLVLSDVVLFN